MPAKLIQDSEGVEAAIGSFTRVLSDLQVANPQESAARIQAVLRGESGPSRDIVVVNAATAIWVTQSDASLASCARLAEAAIDDGRAAALLAELGQLSHQPG